MTKPSSFIFIFFVFSSLFSVDRSDGTGTILFSTVGRSLYAFDVFASRIPSSTSPLVELQLTDGASVNYNGFFSSSPLFSSPQYSLRRSRLCHRAQRVLNHLPRPHPLLCRLPVSSERSHRAAYPPPIPTPPAPLPRLRWPTDHLHEGPPFTLWRSPHIRFHPRTLPIPETELGRGLTSALPFPPQASGPRWPPSATAGGPERCRDSTPASTSSRPSTVGYELWSSSTEGGHPGPMIPPSFFHRQNTDGWWSVYKASISTEGHAPSLISIDRITPPGFHAFTPAASAAAPGLVAVATRRPTSQFRHIEVIDLRGGGNAYVEITRPIAPHSHHYNPFFSPDASRVAYHRCRGGQNDGSPPLLLENLKSLSPETFSLFRIHGSFPSFSHHGQRIAYVGLPGVYVVNSDGSNPRQVYNGNAFPTSWDWKRKGVIYTSHGPGFATESTGVDIISITLSDKDDQGEPFIKKLTSVGKNNAFPSPSPDGKWVVFRSGRSGHKNLYIMDAVEGESAGIYQLTTGPWTDTMCNWSPDGEWIAFASDRHKPGSGSFSIYMVHPNGTGLRRVVHSGEGGRTNHPWFSPDSKSLVFTSDLAGVSAEPISIPHQYQPYGDIFTVNIDGSNVRRLTHNSYEDGTPTWSPFFLEPADVVEALPDSARCLFDDCHWLSLGNRVDSGTNGNSC
ncbi:hypothetical protein HPP92_002714 [Vanilla planifolia]|uniref:Uncharacterized protein n=2 Tax=Vanilla planifolia TaxID=51239 RepID=A0A835VKU5_VANPL|nr:hypothetical protein HPP92_002714 [Vanilla planifolia]